MNNTFTWGGWLREWAFLTLGILIATHVVPPIGYDSTATLALTVFVLSILNAIVRPLLQFFLLLIAAPLVLLTLGLAALLVQWLANALLFYAAGALVPGFRVPEFADAMLGALVVSVVAWLLDMLTGGGGGNGRPRANRRRRSPRNDDDVIDV